MKKEITNEMMLETITRIAAEFSGFTDCIAGLVIPIVSQCDAENRAIEYAYHTDAWMKNTNHVMHGGVTATILDISMGLLTMCFYGGNTMTPTINMQISYLRPIPTDSDVLVRAHISHTGKNICHATAEMYSMDDHNKLYATATGTYYIIEE